MFACERRPPCDKQRLVRVADPAEQPRDFGPRDVHNGTRTSSLGSKPGIAERVNFDDVDLIGPWKRQPFDPAKSIALFWSETAGENPERPVCNPSPISQFACLAARSGRTRAACPGTGARSIHRRPARQAVRSMRTRYAECRGANVFAACPDAASWHAATVPRSRRAVPCRRSRPTKPTTASARCAVRPDPEYARSRCKPDPWHRFAGTSVAGAARQRNIRIGPRTTKAARKAARPWKCEQNLPSIGQARFDLGFGVSPSTVFVAHVLFLAAPEANGGKRRDHAGILFLERAAREIFNRWLWSCDGSIRRVNIGGCISYIAIKMRCYRASLLSRDRWPVVVVEQQIYRLDQQIMRCLAFRDGQHLELPPRLRFQPNVCPRRALVSFTGAAWAGVEAGEPRFAVISFSVNAARGRAIEPSPCA